MAKAAQDEYVLERLAGDAQAPIEVFGFHAQQAAEKMFKAALVAANTNYPRTHRIAELIDRLRHAGVEVPHSFDPLCDLTPFAVEFRYDVSPGDDEEPIDHLRLLDLLRELRAWARSLAG